MNCIPRYKKISKEVILDVSENETLCISNNNIKFPEIDRVLLNTSEYNFKSTLVYDRQIEQWKMINVSIFASKC